MRQRPRDSRLGQLAGAIAGAVVGGGWGQVISEGSQFGLGTAMLKYSRDYEKQADLLGAQIMARAGYDPRDLGRMFETIQKEARAGGPAVAEQPSRSRQSFRLHRQGGGRAAVDAARGPPGGIPAGATALRRPAAGAIDGRRRTWRRERTDVGGSSAPHLSAASAILCRRRRRSIAPCRVAVYSTCRCRRTGRRCRRPTR